MSDETKKDDYYFSHDMGARNDPKILSLRIKYNSAGYGIYFMLIEIMRADKNYRLLLDKLPEYAFDIRCEENVLKGIVHGFDLFVTDGKSFFSPRLRESMEQRKELRDKRIEAGKRGGEARAKQWLSKGSSNAIANVSDCVGIKGKERKGKERKEYSEDSDELRLSALLFNSMKERDPKLKEPTAATQQKWAHEINLLIRTDGRTEQEIRNVINWVQADSFEQTNVRSPAKLRKRFPQLLEKTTKAAGTTNYAQTQSEGITGLQDGTRAVPVHLQPRNPNNHPDDPIDRNVEMAPVKEVVFADDQSVYVRRADMKWYNAVDNLVPASAYGDEGDPHYDCIKTAIAKT